MKEKGGLGLEQRFCRRCLLKEMDADAYFSNVYEYIASLSEDERAPEELYQQRLNDWSRLRSPYKRNVRAVWLFCGSPCGQTDFALCRYASALVTKGLCV